MAMLIMRQYLTTGCREIETVSGCTISVLFYSKSLVLATSPFLNLSSMQQRKQGMVESNVLFARTEFKYIHHLCSDYTFPFTILSFNENVCSSYKSTTWALSELDNNIRFLSLSSDNTTINELSMVNPIKQQQVTMTMTSIKLISLN